MYVVRSQYRKPRLKPIRSVRSRSKKSIASFRPRVAYFSMEMGIAPEIPTYSGGLGILAGDHMRTAAREGLPIIGITLLYHKGYFDQKLDASGWQSEHDQSWRPQDRLKPSSVGIFEIPVNGRRIKIKPWLYEVERGNGKSIPIYFLDTDLEGNTEFDRSITQYLYRSQRPEDNEGTRLFQEIVLGFGGVRLLSSLYGNRKLRYHMNEGHASFLGLRLLERLIEKQSPREVTEELIAEVGKQCVFTTHTPVPAGHDSFSRDLVESALGSGRVHTLEQIFSSPKTPSTPSREGGGWLNMSLLGIALSRVVNGVSIRHGEVSREMFQGRDISSVTNGVDINYWTGEFMARLFDEKRPSWRLLNDDLRVLPSVVTLEEVGAAHTLAKSLLIETINRNLPETEKTLDLHALTFGFARRMTPYKRALFLFSDMDRLVEICNGSEKGMQFLFAGKAHAYDDDGKKLIQEIISKGRELSERTKGKGRVLFLPNYGIELAKMLVSGVDIWLNTPERPLEASGTSGMKAGANGVPSLTVADGWFREAVLASNGNGAPGWIIGSMEKSHSDDEAQREVDSLYRHLATIRDLHDHNQARLNQIRLDTIALVGSYFNMQRMLRAYQRGAYQI